MIGSDFNLKVKLTNKNSKSFQRVFLAINGSTIYYTGIKKTRVMQYKSYINLDPGAGKYLFMRLYLSVCFYNL